MPEPLTGGLAQWRVLPVRKKMFNFAAEVARPKQSLARHCRQAAVTLAAICGQRSAFCKREKSVIGQSSTINERLDFKK